MSSLKQFSFVPTVEIQFSSFGPKTKGREIKLKQLTQRKLSLFKSIFLLDLEGG